MNNGYTPEVEELLEKLRVNCVQLEKYHRKEYYGLESWSKYFRMPILILAGVNATASVGLQEFIAQKFVSLGTCMIGMIISILTATELYLNISADMEMHLKCSKEYYSLSVEIYKTLHLPYCQRAEAGVSFLNKKYGAYLNLKKTSNLMTSRRIYDTVSNTPPILRKLKKKNQEPDNSDESSGSGNGDLELTEVYPGMGKEKSYRFLQPSTPSPTLLDKTLPVERQIEEALRPEASIDTVSILAGAEEEDLESTA